MVLATPMPPDAEFQRAQKAILEAEKTRLEAELARIARKDTVGDDYHAQFEDIGRHEDENALEVERYEAARSSEQSLELKLRDVNAALARLSAGAYGACGQCGAPIERERLTALPSATTCRQHAK